MVNLLGWKLSHVCLILLFPIFGSAKWCKLPSGSLRRELFLNVLPANVSKIHMKSKLRGSPVLRKNDFCLPIVAKLPWPENTVLDFKASCLGQIPSSESIIFLAGHFIQIQSSAIIVFGYRSNAMAKFHRQRTQCLDSRPNALTMFHHWRAQCLASRPNALNTFHHWRAQYLTSRPNALTKFHHLRAQYMASKPNALTKFHHWKWWVLPDSAIYLFSAYLRTASRWWVLCFHEVIT